MMGELASKVYVLSKYSDQKEFNGGFPKGENILVVNDDNVFPEKWWELIEPLSFFPQNFLVVPNQIEPTRPIFPPFLCKDFGRVYTMFNFKEFYEHSRGYPVNSFEELEYSIPTLPFIIPKHLYLEIGGWDETCPGPWVVDVDFFYKLYKRGVRAKRWDSFRFYHFGSKTAVGEEYSQEQLKRKQEGESRCWRWMISKWSPDRGFTRQLDGSFK